MAGRRRIVKIGPPTRGLTDFPEHASPEHSTQALNVEYVNGGVSTRRGTELVKDDFYTQGGSARTATIKLVRQFVVGPGRSEMTVVGFVPTAGGDANSERVIVDSQEDFMRFDPPALPGQHAQLTAANPRTNQGTHSRWDACMFMETIVVCTDMGDNNFPQVFYKKPGQGFVPLDGFFTGPVDRTRFPFHQGGDNPSSAASDDPGNYEFMAGRPMRARFCRVARNRLFLANLDDPKLPLPDAFFSGRAALWYSNLEDIRGWRLDGIHLPASGDQGAITGLATRGDHVVVFRAASVSLFRVDGPGHNEFVYRQVVSGRGCVANSTILDDVSGMTCFMSQDGFYGFDGSKLIELSAPIRPTIRKAIEASGDWPAGAHATHYPLRNQVWLSIATKGAAPDTVFVMDYRNGHAGSPAWSMFEFQTAAWAVGGQLKRLGGFCTNSTGTEMYGVTIGSNNRGDYEKFDMGDAADHQGGSEVGFTSRWESGPVDYNSNSVKRWRYIRPMIRPTMDSSMTGWWRTDEQGFDGVQFHFQSVQFAPDDDSGGAALGAFVLNTGRLGAAEDHGKRLDVHSGGLCRYGRIGVQTNGTVNHKFDVRSSEIDTLQRPRSRR